MICVFNRIQLLSTYDQIQCHNVTMNLEKEHIPYKVVLKNAGAYSCRSAAQICYYGSYGGVAKSRYEYRIYVHKKDYSKSQAVMYVK